jgi:hypothetical protein
MRFPVDAARLSPTLKRPPRLRPIIRVGPLILREHQQFSRSRHVNRPTMHSQLRHPLPRPASHPGLSPNHIHHAAQLRVRIRLHPGMPRNLPTPKRKPPRRPIIRSNPLLTTKREQLSRRPHLSRFCDASPPKPLSSASLPFDTGTWFRQRPSAALCACLCPGRSPTS